MNNETELTTREQRAELMEMVNTVKRGLNGLDRKRSLRDSERAMTAAKYKRAITALRMAIDRIDREDLA